ncbi:unnamed protein product [Medioppia subpectinata]|uniref:Uncharacterized protein n=1 Tax=Medioppia subpectinata TaxID=1979941 RepID=A0A7R9KH70_9ACAR|nr:unnamed protein product [Medioppia subpectinata]CAG2103272.1 unnamed protein product [Medioppia subpectinata]
MKLYYLEKFGIEEFYCTHAILGKYWLYATQPLANLKLIQMMATVRPFECINVKTITVMSEQSVRFSKSDSKIMTEVSNNPNNEAPLKSGGSLDANVYATKKTIAQGMLDVALLTANASQLKYCLQLGKKSQFYYLMVTLISTSIVLQIGLGAAIVMKSRYNINKDHHHRTAIMATLLIGGIFVMVGYINFNDERRQRNLNLMNNSATIFIGLGAAIIMKSRYNINKDHHHRSANFDSNVKCLITGLALYPNDL